MRRTSLARPPCIMVFESFWGKRDIDADGMIAISEGRGDAALVLLEAGAETDKRDGNGRLAIELAPNKVVNNPGSQPTFDEADTREKVKNFITESVEREGIDLG
jgi:26S proteasome non-ATPase regulatory subunit 10